MKKQINKIISYIDEHTSAYDNGFKIGVMLILVMFLLLLKGGIFED